MKKDSIQLIRNIGELTELFKDSASLEVFLKKTVELIAQHMKSQVCSIYLYSKDKNELILKANKGLNEGYVNNVKMKLGEGLTGLALKELRPINESYASQNPNFKYFPGLGEEHFESLLAVPIARGQNRIGVIVVQNRKSDFFEEDDINVLCAITSQLANVIEMTQLILSLEELPEPAPQIEKKDLKFIKGKVGSAGFGYAKVLKYGAGSLRLKPLLVDVNKQTIDDFYSALKETEKQLEHLQQSIEEKLFDVASLIFSAQILMLKDQSLIDGIVNHIHSGHPPVIAINAVIQEYVKKFQALPNAYLREKAQDVKDIGQRLINNLTGQDDCGEHCAGRIAVANEIFPSDILKFSSQKIQGVVVLHGGETAHVSILAQSLQIPLVIADYPDLLTLTHEDEILLDAEVGNIYVNPSKEIIDAFQEKRRLALKITDVKARMDETTKTMDGTIIHLMANINLLGEVKRAMDYKAEGIGLYRTEFPFIVRSAFPTEEEQVVIYQKLIHDIPGKEVTFRTLDIGGDKVLSYFEEHKKEKNPYLGLRSIRFSLSHIDVFTQQIRAILRAGFKANLRIMFPMISSVDEFIQAKSIVLDQIQFLKAKNVFVNDHPQIGLMMETPSVISIADDLAQEADFFSIGTNDFIQYMLAVDRSNEKVADYYLPYHPSVLRGFNAISESGKRYGIDVSVCGDMAHDPRFVKFFLGIGIRKLSVNPNDLYKIQKAIQKFSMKEAEQFSHEALSISRIENLKKIFFNMEQNTKE